ncbi:hypothetical protein EJ357_46680 [Streptomyces cyaneochromogenes]|uniref:Uncharacterized protein n=1 Tax=Streptomyces cyaneochromogenes TaxID=2496836 RepID=A0A3S9MPH7_9ACTN|nr:hypothetical protein [Streptomyces cyaneochromogenes]AZQ40951.1 hypothetical protein EJ357_46680 [Streptomyces cyaneochromogenes]
MGRYYTGARRHPWVLGKVADWRIPLGPYTPAQIALAVGGGFVLIKTFGWWSWMGPVPIVAWVLAIWTVRRPKIRGRAPLPAAWGWALLAVQPAGGRISGRAARDRAGRALLGGFTLEGAPAASPRLAAAAAPTRGATPRGGRRPRRRAARLCACARPHPVPAQPKPVLSVRPVSGVQQLLYALAEQGGGVR